MAGVARQAVKHEIAHHEKGQQAGSTGHVLQIVIFITAEGHFLPIIIPGRFRTVLILHQVVGPAVLILQLIPLGLLLLPAARHHHRRAAGRHKSSQNGCCLCTSIHVCLLYFYLMKYDLFFKYHTI